MAEIRRSRTRAPEPVRLGRTRIAPPPLAEMPRPVRRTPRDLIDTDALPRGGRMEDIPETGEVEVFALRVYVEVTSGVVSPEDFKRWMQEAVDKYHSFRAGYMDPCLGGTAKCPTVYLADEPLDE